MKPLKGLVSLIVAYAAGVFVKSHYDKKKNTKKTKTSDNFLDKASDAGRDFLDTHRQIFEDLKSEYWTPENETLFQNKKKDLMNFFQLIKSEVIDTAQDLKKKGMDSTHIDEKIMSIYEEKKDILHKLGATPLAQAAKKKVTEISRAIKNKTTKTSTKKTPPRNPKTATKKAPPQAPKK